MDLLQRQFITGDTCKKSFLVRHDVEIAIDIIGPGVIGAAEVCCMTPLFADKQVAAMLTDVVEPLYIALAGAGYQDLLPAQVKHEVVARICDILFEAGEATWDASHSAITSAALAAAWAPRC